ncbi:MAG: hypothetical protein HYR96_01375 [Deltaproteobacteria bacterium]|nr:hypothetical protein [Deltaproteobacteria bacterium]MBI3294368.1 hypothetical protein [Deltaproteobacteria bacterium]
MKKITILLSTIFSLSSWAIPPDARFDSISLGADGNTHLNFNFNEFGTDMKLTLVDDDGMATATALHYMLIQGPSNEVWNEKSTWAKLKDQPVKAWDKNVSELYLASLARIKALNETMAQEMGKRESSEQDDKKKGLYALNKKLFEEKGAEAKQLIEEMTALNGKIPSYQDLNKFGAWLENAARQHAYTVESRQKTDGGVKTVSREGVKLLDNDTTNPIGTSFGSRPLTLPPQFMSRSRTTFDGDLKKILATYKASLVGAVQDAEKDDSKKQHK